MPAYGTQQGKATFGGQNAESVYVVGYKAKSWSSLASDQSDQYETVSSNGYKSIPASILKTSGGQHAITWRLAYASAPASVSATLQGAQDDVDAEYVTVDTSTATAGETKQVQSNFKYYRVLFGTAPAKGTIVAIEAV